MSKKSNKNCRQRSYRRQIGSAVAEYLVAVSFVTAALFLPVFQDEGGDGQTSAADMLAQALLENYRAYIWAMSIPI